MTQPEPIPASGVTVGRVKDDFDSEKEAWERQVAYLMGQVRKWLVTARALKHQRDIAVENANDYGNRAYAYLLLLGKSHDEARKEMEECRKSVELS